MQQKLHAGIARSFALIVLVACCQFLTFEAGAQSRLIHYWNFNTLNYNDTIAAVPGTVGCLTTPVLNNRIRSIAPDYSIMPSVAVYPSAASTAAFAFVKQPGVSANYPSVAVETVCYTFLDFVSGSTVGAFLGAPAGSAARPRNPTDSMEVRLYAPTTGYQNIVISFATEGTSTTLGGYMNFSYSLDSGVTWKTQGLSITNATVASSSVFIPSTISIADPAAYNNPKFVFRIQDSLHAAQSSGNIRYDNIAVQGDTVVPGGTLIHFWDFNTFATSFHPGSPISPISCDYTIHDPTKATVLWGLFPGTSSSNPTYFDFGSAAGTDYDTVNSNWSSVPALGVVSPGNWIRMRNPNDSTYLYVYMPSVNYKNINLKFAAQTSSQLHGDSIQVYSYSVDSGLTWRQSGISEALDSAWQVGMPVDPAVIPFRPVPISIKFTDPAANNSSKLVFRIHLAGRSDLLSGNNRLDNFSVQGDSIVAPLPTITTIPASYGPLCNTAANSISVAFTTTGSMGQPYSVQLSNELGVFPANTTSGIIGTGTSSPITAVVPAGTPAGSVYRVRVVSSYPGIYGSDNGSDIILNGVAGPISGPSTVCAAGANITLSESGAGTWTSSNTSLATVGTSSGIVTGLLAGVDTIVYSIGVGCTASKTITVNPIPSTITGTANACVGLSSTLSDATGSGSWSSGTIATATVGSGTGVVSGVAAGSTVISYTLPTGCFNTQSFTVNPLPSAISGVTVFCQGNTSALTDAGGGSWSSGTTSVATVGSGSGVVFGASGGTSVITYTLPTGCIATAPVTINPTPAVIGGGATGCVGATTNLTDATGFGAWTSSSTGVATVGSSTGVVSGITVGTTVISYTVSTGCYITQTMTINSLPSGITGTAVVCATLTTTLNSTTTGGTWSSSNTALATVGSTGIVTGVAAGTPVITYALPTGCFVTKVVTVNPLPAAIGGTASVYCIGSTANLTDASGGGVWTSSNTGVATVGSASGIVTGVAAGTSTITYALPTGCITTLVENISSSPAVIAGSSNACAGATTALTDVTAFGAWTSSNTGIATVGSGTGVVTGVAAGTATITYSLSSFCLITKVITVNVPPTAITGVMQVCAGLNTTLSDTGSGTWSSSVPALATVGAGTGVVTGIAPGNPLITYTAPSGCIATAVFTVNPLPVPISGSTSVYCIGSSSTLNDLSAGGSWSSNNIAVVTVGSSSGVVTGITAGSAIITYTLPTGCITTLTENISSTPATITGSATTCVSTVTNLSDSTAFGAWSSSNTSVATIGSGNGVVTGLTAGSTVITYQLSPLCLITKTVTVNPLPTAISGTTQVCIGSTTALSDAGGGTWTSNIPVLASIGSATGIVTGNIAGSVTVTYTLPTGCATTAPVTVNPLPLITSPGSICLGLPAVLTGNIGGGAWVSASPSVATVGSSTGVIMGASLGTTTITYTVPTTCSSTTVVTVNAPTAPISGTLSVCEGGATTLADAGGGGWYSNNPSVATVGFGTGVVSAISAGTATITYTMGSTCISTAVLTVNAVPAAITGTATTCPGVVTTLGDITVGGTWSSSDVTLATVGSATGDVTGVSAGTSTITYMITNGCIATKAVTVNPISPITGALQVCTGLTVSLSDALGGGSWTSSSGSAVVGASSGVATGVSAGLPTITYTLPSGCYTTAMLTVDTAPASIAGTMDVCQGRITTLSDLTSGGSWTSGATSVATIGSGTGDVSGITAGTTDVTYTLSNGCMAMSTVTVNPLPSAITGATQVCVASTATLADATAGGAWSSAGTGIATVAGSTGVVTGVAAGSTMITYMLATGCIATTSYTVNSLPALKTVTGGGAFCAGGAGLHVGLGGSDGGIRYQLYRGVTSVGTALAGTGSAIDFGYQTAGGSYTVLATDTTTSCAGTMTGSALIVANPLPRIMNMTGGGFYCEGGSGVHVGLSNSDTGVNYQLYRGGAIVGSALPGSGLGLDFGSETVTGTYTAVATNATTGCTNNMAGTETVALDTLYTPVVSITGHPGAGIKYGQSDTLTAVVSNGGPGVTYQWLVNLSYVAGATSSTYISNTLANHDSVTCFVSSHSPCGSVITPAHVIISITNLGINELSSLLDNVVLTPNPNKGTFRLKGTLADADNQEVAVSITNTLGQTVYTTNVHASNGELDQVITLSNSIANGMYILSLNAGKERKVFHIVIEQ